MLLKHATHNPAKENEHFPLISGVNMTDCLSFDHIHPSHPNHVFNIISLGVDTLYRCAVRPIDLVSKNLKNPKRRKEVSC